MFTLLSREHSNIREQGLQLYSWHHVDLKKKERQRQWQSEDCQSGRNVEEKGVVHLWNRMCARICVHESRYMKARILLFFYTKNQSASIWRRAEAAYISMLVVQWAFRVTMKARERMKVSFDRKCKILCHASHFVGGRFTYICTYIYIYIHREYFEMIVAHVTTIHTQRKYFSVINGNVN